MKMFHTTAEAIEICRNTYKGRIYHLYDEVSGKELHGTAYDIYGEFFMASFLGHRMALYALDILDIEGLALIETIRASVGISNTAAIDLMNQITEEGDAAWS